MKNVSGSRSLRGGNHLWDLWTDWRITLKVILNNRISSKLWNNGNAGGEASNPITTANFTASCVPLTFFSNQTVFHEILQIIQCICGMPVVLHVLSICAVTPTARSILVSPDSWLMWVPLPPLPAPTKYSCISLVRREAILFSVWGIDLPGTGGSSSYCVSSVSWVAFAAVTVALCCL
jgi:hypothetical protein